MTYERPNIAAMQGYSYGEQPDDGSVTKLNTNENPYPPSPAVTAALQNLDATALRIYPNATANPLRDAIAQQHGLHRDNVVVTNGGDEALRLAITTFIEPGAGFGMAEPSYSLYPVLANVQDATVFAVELDEDWQLPTSAAQRLNDASVALTCIVNPHAPSGTLMSPQGVTDLAQQLNGVLLLDEAYVDFVEDKSNHNTPALISANPNLLLLRTFSKGYSLAGLRLGYLLGDASLIQPVLEKTRDSYNVDHISQQLGLAAFTDQTYAEKTWQRVRDDRDALSAGLQQLGFHVLNSEANFLLAQAPQGHHAQHLYSELKTQGVLVRYFDAPRLQDKLRITVGTHEQNQDLINRLSALLS